MVPELATTAAVLLRDDGAVVEPAAGAEVPVENRDVLKLGMELGREREEETIPAGVVVEGLLGEVLDDASPELARLVL